MLDFCALADQATRVIFIAWIFLFYCPAMRISCQGNSCVDNFFAMRKSYPLLISFSFFCIFDTRCLTDIKAQSKKEKIKKK